MRSYDSRDCCRWCCNERENVVAFGHQRNDRAYQNMLKSTSDYVRWSYFEALYDLDKNHEGNARACPKITHRHVVLDTTSKMRVRLATQIFSNCVAHGLQFYLSHGCKDVNGCEETIAFCKFYNNLFDALNRKMPNEGLTPQSNDFKIRENSAQQLNEWETNVLHRDIPPEEFRLSKHRELSESLFDRRWTSAVISLTNSNFNTY